MRSLARAAAAAALAAGATAALAHDFWIEPTPLRPKAGAEVAFALRFGDEFAGEKFARDDLRIVKFAIVGPDGAEQPVPGKTKEDPAGRLTLAKPGVHVAGYRGTRKSLEMEAAKFEAYLVTEGLEKVSAERKRLGETEKASREVFSRCAKTIVQVGDETAGPFGHVFGFTLEVVPDGNPALACAGTESSFRVLYEGKPLEGALVTVRAASAPKEPIRGRTDKDGRVKVKLVREGFTLVNCVHMVRSDPEKTGADWESLWASVTFAVPAAPTPR